MFVQRFHVLCRHHDVDISSAEESPEETFTWDPGFNLDTLDGPWGLIVFRGSVI